MNYNLLEERWLPVRRLSGTKHWVSVSEIVSEHDSNPIVRLDFGRPDLDGSVLQFLIGLVQTRMADRAESSKEWLDCYISPPASEDIEEDMEDIKPAFNLVGPYPRFMQDESAEVGTEWELKTLLIDGFGASAHFVKYQDFQSIALPFAAAALITHQFNTTNSGAGAKAQHRSSVRNAGFVTTIVTALEKKADRPQSRQSLWRTIWLNVLPKQEFLEFMRSNDRDDFDYVFPWMPEYKMPKSGRDIRLSDAHALTAYWGMPRRVHLVHQEGALGTCALSGLSDVEVVRGVRVQPNGYNYLEWRHPLSPIRKSVVPADSKKGAEDSVPTTSFVKVPTETVSYAHWMNLTIGRSTAKYTVNRVPALQIAPERFKSLQKHVEKLRAGKQEEGTLEAATKNIVVNVFGFEADNAKIVTFRQAEMIYIDIDEQLHNEFIVNTERLVELANDAQYALVNACKAVAGMKKYKANPEDPRKGEWVSIVDKQDGLANLVFAQKSLFWGQTESDFYKVVRQLREVLLARQDRESAVEIDMVHSQWKETLKRHIRSIFRDAEQAIPAQHQDMRSVVRAEQELIRWPIEKKKPAETKRK